MVHEKNYELKAYFKGLAKYVDKTIAWVTLSTHES